MTKDRSFVYAIATLVGTIVGAGIFAIPYVISKSGFLIGIVFLIGLGIITLLLHLFYGEIVSRTKEKHRLAGYAEKYLGKWGKFIVSIAVILSAFGALLVYIIIGGEFLRAIFPDLFGGSSLVFSLLFFIPLSLMIFKDLKMVAVGEFLMDIFLLIALGIIVAMSFPKINYQNFIPIDFKNLFFPYGVILFALAGGAAIPEIKDILGEEKKYKKVIIIGTLIPVVLYILFSFAVVGVSGGLTSKEAILGLGGFLGKGAVMAGSVLGIFAIATSFLVLGLFLKKTFWYDYKINKNLSWVLACFIPLVGFLLNLKDFIAILGAAGAVFGGLEGIFIVLIHRRAKKMGDRTPVYSLKVPNFLSYVIIGVFMLGAAYQIFYFFH